MLIQLSRHVMWPSKSVTAQLTKYSNTDFRKMILMRMKSFLWKPISNTKVIKEGVKLHYHCGTWLFFAGFVTCVDYFLFKNRRLLKNDQIWPTFKC